MTNKIKLTPFADADGDEQTPTLKISKPTNCLPCFECKDSVPMSEGLTENNMLVGTRYAKRYPAYVTTTNFEGYCYNCNRTYTLIVRSKH